MLQLRPEQKCPVLKRLLFDRLVKKEKSRFQIIGGECEHADPQGILSTKPLNRRGAIPGYDLIAVLARSRSGLVVSLCNVKGMGHSNRREHYRDRCLHEVMLLRPPRGANSLYDEVGRGSGE